jgi:putative glutamine amidotransferase
MLTMAQRLIRPANPNEGESPPVIGVVCCNRQVEARRAQVVANRFVEPLARIAGASVVLVPALPEAVDVRKFAGLLDGLLLTGACSNLAAARYGQDRADAGADEGRDEVALRLSEAMIEAGRPVFGICRGLQELNVLFGGTLAPDVGQAGHHSGADHSELAALFDHHHGIEVAGTGLLAEAIGAGGRRVNSVHFQGIDRLGSGLVIEARAQDGLIEAISANPCGAPVLGVQWHPEWDVDENPDSRGFFELLGQAVLGATQTAGRQ